MMDSFNRQVLRVAVAQICQSMGWDAVQKSTHDTLTDVMQRYLEEIGKVAHGYTQLCNRTNPNLDDLHLAFQDTGVVLNELENYVAQVDPVQFIHPFTTYPSCKPCRLQHPSSGEIVDRADFYSEHLPPLPKVCHEEPKDESKENPTEENSKMVGPEDAEKMKSPLKESNHNVEMSDEVSAKRSHDGGMFVPDSKRARLDIPANLNLEKKENIENTDGESLSPATPVSPYLPQEVPRSPEVPKKEAKPSKIQTEPKKTPGVLKEMVLPLKKIAPTDKKMKIQSSPGTPKKSKVKSDLSDSSKVQKKSPSPIPRHGSPMSTQKLSKTGKKSPSPKLKSPEKISSPVTEKTSPLVKKISNKSHEKSKSAVVSPAKESPLKSPPSSVVLKKEKDSSVVKPREDKPPKKKKKKISDEPEGSKSSRQDAAANERLNTPKLMIKLLPKPDVGSAPAKASPKGRESLTALVKAAKTPTTPETKKKIKIKAKLPSAVSTPKPVDKMKISSGSVEPFVKKEHSKKKKKKKDKDKDRDREKDREKHKTFKTEKTEPPIPKIRFKLDPTGESKVVEKKPTVTPKVTTSSASKKSTIVVETEKVSRRIITQTLSNNTLDYDPGKAYFCPVCKKQDDGSPMVGCDGCDEWCHWSCVGLIAAPPEDEEWYCPQCLLRREKSKKNKSKKKHKELVG